MNYYKIEAEKLEQNLNDVLKMTGESVSQTIAKPLVSGSVIVPPDYEEGNPIDDSCEICMNYYCDGSCQE